MRRSVLGVIAGMVVLLAAGCGREPAAPSVFDDAPRRDALPTYLLDGHWKVVQWTVMDEHGVGVDVLSLGGELELRVETGNSRGALVIPSGVPGFEAGTYDLYGVALALGQNARFQLVNPSFVGRAVWTFGERHMAVVRYVERGVEVTVMLQRE